MLKLFSLLSLFLAVPAMAHAQLTDLESRWLQAGQPVIAFAREQGLPIDIIVQPQDAPGAVPLALGYAAGRCKLVLSLRGNAVADPQSNILFVNDIPSKLEEIRKFV